MRLPIINRLRKREYKEIAEFQDSAVDLLYDSYPTAILHGGTVVWRCFSGSRFSYDIDGYLPEGSRKSLSSAFGNAARDYDIKVDKIKDTGNLMFVGLSLGDIYLKIELNHATKRLAPVVTRFERTDGTFRDVLSLNANDLIFEKIVAYKNRMFIRDMYDIYVLSDHATKSTAMAKAIADLMKKLQQPVNEGGDLATLIYDGPIQSFSNMVEHIKGRLI